MHWLFWVIGCNLILTLMLLLLITWFPKYILIAYNRFMILKYGISRKSLKITPKLSIAYMERGPTTSDSPTLLLIHGFSTSKDNYIPLYKYFPRRVRVIAMDLPGHGDSQLKEREDFSIRSFVQHVKKFVDVLGISKSKFHIMGGSMGGHIAGMYAISHPDDVKSAILFCPHGIKNKLEETLAEQALRQNEFVLLPDTVNGFREMMKVICNRDLKLPEVIIQGALQIRKEKFEMFKRVALALREEESLYSLEKNLDKLNTPLFVVWGKQDKILDVACVDVIKSKLPVPPKKIVIMEDGGHTMVLETPRRCASLIMEFVNTF